MRVPDLLHTLHRHPTLAFRREGEALRVIPAAPPEARPVLAHFKPALLHALGGGERVEASRLLSSPFRLLALLAHALGVERGAVLTLWGEEEPRRYLPPGENLAPHLAWADRNLPPPRRLHLAATSGGWSVDLVAGWEVAVEALAGRTRYLLLLPGLEARGWLEAAGKGLVPPEELSVWRRGEAPSTARGWEEALARLGEVAHAAR
ncbi:hypothetical protein [Thermus sp.]|uniref:hypothetical protein n=1 Tax=Thermus sp. TaxID=275 RepID=UPI003D0DDE2D